MNDLYLFAMGSLFILPISGVFFNLLESIKYVIVKLLLTFLFTAFLTGVSFFMSYAMIFYLLPMGKYYPSTRWSVLFFIGFAICWSLLVVIKPAKAYFKEIKKLRLEKSTEVKSAEEKGIEVKSEQV